MSQAGAPNAASLPVGARLRLTLLDENVLFGRDQQRAGTFGRIVGHLISLDAQTVEMTVSGDTIAFPSTSVRRLEFSDGPGNCQSNDRVRVACSIGAVLTAAALGAWGGDKVARQLYEENPSRQKWRLRGAVVGAVLTIPFVHLIGSDRWVEVANWPLDGTR